VFELVTGLDKAAADWSLTLRLADYFDKERAKYKQESEADVGAKGGSNG
jgi:hypothetical protein